MRERGVEGGSEGGPEETEEGGAGHQETSQPIYLTAIYHSESMCQLCLLHGRLAAPPPPSPPLYKVV